MSGLGRDDRVERGVGGTRNDLSGSVQGSVVQVGYSGDIFIGSSGRRVIPHEVPVSLSGFENRKRERSVVGALLKPAASGPVRIAVLTGLPGVGKTATAWTVVSDVEGAFEGGELYVDFGLLRAQDGAAVNAGLGNCLGALGVDRRVMPATLSARVNLYRTYTKDKPVLVTLDDVVEPAEVAPFVPTAPGSVVLVTSNSRLSELVLDDAAIVPIDPLPDAAAVDFLARRSGGERVSLEPEAMRELVRLCGGLPVTLRVAAGRLRSHSSLAVADLVEEIVADEHGLSGFDFPGTQRVSSVFTAAYRGLPADAARLYRWLGLLPGPDFTAEMVAAGGEGKAAEQRRLLEILVEANLVTDDGAGRYRLHGLVRRHARWCASEEEPEQSRMAFIRRVVEYFLRRAAFVDLTVLDPERLRIASYEELLAGVDNPFAGADAKTRALDWLEAERTNALVVLKVAVDEGFPRQAWQLAEAMTALYVNRRYLEDWVESTRLGVRAAEWDGMPEAVARLRSFVSRALTDLGDGAAARAELDAALPIARESGNPRLEASVWELWGRYHDEQARTGNGESRDRAVEAYQRALELFDAAGDQRGYAFVLYYLGKSLDSQGQSELALQTLERARGLIQEIPDQRMADRALASIGTARARLGDTAGAVVVLREAIEGLVAGQHVYYEAQAREALAEVAERIGDRTLRQENLRRALEIHAGFGSPRVADLEAALDD
jgi:tetratricopeptide (TPR) repeat protein